MCTLEDIHQKVLCKEVGTELEDCPKDLGAWMNVGPCVPRGLDQICGPGTQNQTRTCKDGTGKEICNEEDSNQIVSCAQAGTDLPDCPKSYGEWQNVGNRICLCVPLKAQCIEETGVEVDLIVSGSDPTFKSQFQSQFLSQFPSQLGFIFFTKMGVVLKG